MLISVPEANPLVATQAPVTDEPVVIIGKMPLSPLPIAFSESDLVKPLSVNVNGNSTPINVDSPLLDTNGAEPTGDEREKLFKVLNKGNFPF